MKKINRIFTLIHLIPWAVFAGVVLWDILVRDSPVLPNIYLAVLILGLYVFYSHFFILTKYLTNKKYRAYFLALVAMLVTAPILFLLCVDMNDAHYRREGIGMALGGIFAFTTLSFLVRSIQDLIVRSLNKAQLEKHALNAELVYLKSQINPHFLFNTLNNIHALVYMQAATAPDALMRLSSLMRYMLYESNARTVPLSIELDYLKDYIALQQLRYQAQDVVDLQVRGEVGSCEIAPLLFIHLLENAYKHGPSRPEASTIALIVSVEDDQLVFSCENPIGRKTDGSITGPGGIGLANVQKRLQLLYPGKHELKIDNTGKHFKVELKIAVEQSHERKAELLHH